MSVRPRPRPKPRATGSNVSATSAATSPPASTPVDESSAKPPTPQKETEDRIDDRFMKKGRFWSEIDQKEKRAKAAARESSVSESSDEDEEGERTPVKRVYTTGPYKPMPAWTKNGGKTRNKRSPSQERDTEDDDDDVIHLPSGSQNSTSDKECTPRKKKKRARSRSKSLTPPPPISVHMIQQARQLVRETLGETSRHARPPSPTAMEDLVLPEDVLDPELQRLADAIKTKRHQTPDLESSTAMVNITVVWKPHPEADVDTDVPTRTYTIRRNENFHLLFQAVAESAFILTQELVVCYQNRKIFEGATPESLHIYAAGEVVACEQGTYEYLKTSRHSVTPEPEAESRLRSPSVEATPETAAPFKLFFRAGVWKDSVVVRVTSAMTCKDAVALALKAASKANLTNTDLEGKTIHMSIDGDKVDDDETIGNLDVEDSDLVELVGF
ncbi:hypothetical protein SISNIDRAFT_461329 [Sistotremastrum niveocremeum HHB9708]|uniref:Rad60/SUMO-like domain-containing protein n=1 Tax=Sistotremastrum niveocremeum HHB9708 TaxID=1314777 RepID=A0A164MQE2_9AGAM|nr:hypothetical protein SISNIDRAFT_461329 [Sistotremastrum niveocremeum HHB9708]